MQGELRNGVAAPDVTERQTHDRQIQDAGRGSLPRPREKLLMIPFPRLKQATLLGAAAQADPCEGVPSDVAQSCVRATVDALRPFWKCLQKPMDSA